MPEAEAWVYRSGELAGSLERTAEGVAFTYDPAFLSSHGSGIRDGVAYALPPRREPSVQTGANLHPFFAGLLPEGLRLYALQRDLKIAADDLLGQLLQVGQDCIGDVAVVPAREIPEPRSAIADLTRPEALDFQELLEESLRYGQPGAERRSIPGLQDKVSGAMISLPIRASRKGHPEAILKLDPPRFPLLTANEAFFLQMAREAGLEVPGSRLVRDRRGEPGLIVERFDRILARGEVRAIHQEDICQVSGRYPADKYRLTMKDVAFALRICDAPIVETAKMLRMLAFAWVTGNGDLHARNLSLRTEPRRGLIELAPAYDLPSTLPYGDERLALGIEGRDRSLRRRHFVAFGERHGVRAAATESILDQVADRARTWSDRVAEIGFDSETTKALRRAMRERAKGLRS